MEVTTRRFHAPDEVPEFIASSGNNLTLESSGRKAFRASIDRASWNGIYLSRIRSSEARLISRSEPDLLCVCIPESVPLQVSVGAQTMNCSRESACLVNPEDPFQLLLPQSTTLYALTVGEPSLCNYASALSANPPILLEISFR